VDCHSDQASVGQAVVHCCRANMPSPAATSKMAPSWKSCRTSSKNLQGRVWKNVITSVSSIRRSSGSRGRPPRQHRRSRFPLAARCHATISAQPRSTPKSHRHPASRVPCEQCHQKRMRRGLHSLSGPWGGDTAHTGHPGTIAGSVRQAQPTGVDENTARRGEAPMQATSLPDRCARHSRTGVLSRNSHPNRVNENAPR